MYLYSVHIILFNTKALGKWQTGRSSSRETENRTSNETLIQFDVSVAYILVQLQRDAKTEREKHGVQWIPNFFK